MLHESMICTDIVRERSQRVLTMLLDLQLRENILRRGMYSCNQVLAVRLMNHSRATVDIEERFVPFVKLGELV